MSMCNDGCNRTIEQVAAEDTSRLDQGLSTDAHGRTWAWLVVGESREMFAMKMVNTPGFRKLWDSVIRRKG